MFWEWNEVFYAQETKSWLATLTNTILDNYSQGVNKMIEKVQEMEQEFVTMEENSNLKVYYWQFPGLGQWPW